MANTCILCSIDKDNQKNKSAQEKIAHNSELGFDIYYCKKHDLYYGNFDDNKLIRKTNQFYSKKYWAKDARLTNGLMNSIKFLLRQRIMPPRSVSHRHFLKQYLDKKKKILEIGAGKGENIYFMINKGYNINAIEPDSVNCRKFNEYAKKKIAFSGLVENVKLKGKYDIIYMSHSFEHLINPKTFLENIKKNLNKGAIIFIEVPNASIFPKNQKKLAKHIIRWAHHTYHFTEKSLKKLLENEGFKVLTSGTYSEELSDSPSISKRIKSYLKAQFNVDTYRKDKKGDHIRIVARYR